MGITADIVVFATDPVIIHLGDGIEPTSYIFGRTYEEVGDWIVASVKPQEEGLVTIKAQVYDEGVYTNGPPHMSP